MAAVIVFQASVNCRRAGDRNNAHLSSHWSLCVPSIHSILHSQTPKRLEIHKNPELIFKYSVSCVVTIVSPVLAKIKKRRHQFWRTLNILKRIMHMHAYMAGVSWHGLEPDFSSISHHPQRFVAFFTEKPRTCAKSAINDIKTFLIISETHFISMDLITCRLLVASSFHALDADYKTQEMV